MIAVVVDTAAVISITKLSLSSSLSKKGSGLAMSTARDFNLDSVGF
jgi:hypothetical protein